MNTIERITKLNRQQMSTISFEELVKELTGTSYEEMYKEYLNNGDNDVQRESDME